MQEYYRIATNRTVIFLGYGYTAVIFSPVFVRELKQLKNEFFIVSQNNNKKKIKNKNSQWRARN